MQKICRFKYVKADRTLMKMLLQNNLLFLEQLQVDAFIKTLD